MNDDTTPGVDRQHGVHRSTIGADVTQVSGVLHEVRFPRLVVDGTPLLEPGDDPGETGTRYEEYVIRSDEPAMIGGTNEHPWPGHYLAAGIGTCLLTQIMRYAKMFKIRVDDAEIRVRVHWCIAGSVMEETLKVDCTGVDMDVSLVSDEAPERIAWLVSAAREGCFVEAVLAAPIEADVTLSLNDRVVDTDTTPRFGQANGLSP
jgi:uncharacterized OsmC-like protein